MTRKKTVFEKWYVEQYGDRPSHLALEDLHRDAKGKQYVAELAEYLFEACREYDDRMTQTYHGYCAAQYIREAWGTETVPDGLYSNKSKRGK